MKTIATLVIAALVLTAKVSSAAECRITQYPDHDEAVCDGTGKAAPPTHPSQQPSQQAARPERSRIEKQQPGPEEVVTQQQEDNNGEIRINMSQIGRRHAELWLATTPRW